MNKKIMWLFFISGLCTVHFGFAGKKPGYKLTPYTDKYLVDLSMYRLLHTSGILKKDFPKDVRNSIADLLMQKPENAKLAEELQYVMDENIDCKEEDVAITADVVTLAEYARSCKQAQKYIVAQLADGSFAKWEIGNCKDVDVFNLNCSGEKRLWVAGDKLIIFQPSGLKFKVFDLETKALITEGVSVHDNMVVLDEDTYLTFYYDKVQYDFRKCSFKENNLSTLSNFSALPNNIIYSKYSHYSKPFSPTATIDCDVQNNQLLLFSNHDEAFSVISLENDTDFRVDIDCKKGVRFLEGSSKILCLDLAHYKPPFPDLSLHIFNSAENKKRLVCKKMTNLSDYYWFFKSVSIAPDLFAIHGRSNNGDFIKLLTLSSSYYAFNPTEIKFDGKSGRQTIKQLFTTQNRLIALTDSGKIKIYKVCLQLQLAQFFNNGLTCAQAILFTFIAQARLAGKKLPLPSFLHDTYLQLNSVLKAKFGSDAACAVKEKLDKYIAKTSPIKK